MGFVIRRVLTPIVARLGSRAILGIGGALFLVNMAIPDPLPLVDEFLILAGTILLSRWAKRAEDAPERSGDAANASASARPVGRGSTHR